ncbi:hypothetical protein [Bacillus sp. Marseille-Q3570]|uniref:hypothetical protein n=1 Tax=Bacillus sp. Marseille-Q3570 TaxID=2963522 RepID=UPI0021B8084B|nr:hypothetical protein [Bacillus sp. Marseille-Q3570]
MNRKLKMSLFAIVCVTALLLISCPTADDYQEWLSENNILNCNYEKCFTVSSDVTSAGYTKANIDQVKESGSAIHTGGLFFMTAETYINEKDRTIKVIGLLNFMIPYENKLDNGMVYSIDFLD